MLNLEEAFSASENDNDELLEYDYTIDENLRIISMSQYGSILGVEGDKDINRTKFKMVRFYKGFDLSKFSPRVNYANANGELNYYEVKDLEVIGDFISFTWLVGYDATAYKGTIRFIVRLLNTEEDKIINAFDTTIAEARSLEGLDVDNYIAPVVIEDMLYHLRKDLNDYTLTKMDELNGEGQRVLATIPSDYQDTISALLRVSSMYDVITDSSGAPILDSSSGSVQSTKRFAEESEIVNLDRSVTDLQYLIEKYRFERVLIRLGNLENNLGNIDKAVFNVFEEYENINLSFTNGKYYWRDKANFAMVETETSNARYSVVSLENGQKYRYEGSYPKNTYPTLVFFDDNNIAREVLLVSANSNGEKVTYEFIADTSIATKLSINCLSIRYTTEPKLEKLGVTKKQNKIDILENEVNSITEVHSQSKTMKTETLSDGQSILFDEKIGIRKNVTSMFYADITSFSKIYIGYTPTNANGGVKYIAIDNVNLYVYGNTGRIDGTYPHELSFGKNISVILDCNDNTKCKVTILTNGLIYQKEVDLIPYPLTALYCLSEGSILRNIKLSWCCKDILKDIWVFGDSYVDLYNVRWMWHLIQNGYGNNILLSGVAGSTSSDAIISFKNLLKYAVWCMGMNDFNDTDINTPNTAWKTAYDEFLSLCKLNNIMPILATIPNVPQRTHIAKNKIVKESGYRYIDFAHAVGADEQGATWYDSLLSSDNIHPSVQGARVLYGEALAAFPEFAVIN